MKSVSPAFFLLHMIFMGFEFVVVVGSSGSMMCRVYELFRNYMFSRCLLVFLGIWI